VFSAKMSRELSSTFKALIASSILNIIGGTRKELKKEEDFKLPRKGPWRGRILKAKKTPLGKKTEGREEGSVRRPVKTTRG